MSLKAETRVFNHLETNKSGTSIMKTSANARKLSQEIEWYLKLPRELQDLVPRINRYSTDKTAPYIDMEVIEWKTLHEYLLEGSISVSEWEKIFGCLKEVLTRFSSYETKTPKISAALNEMYYTKTRERLKVLRGDPNFQKFFSCSITVNGNVYISLDEVADKLERVVAERLCQVKVFPIIHGDFCFSNIFVNSSFTAVKLIDARGSFGVFDIYGDRRYDLAKLFHSIDGGYDFIINDMYSVKYDTNKVTIDYSVKSRRKTRSIFKALKSVLESEIGKERGNIELIEALLFLSMIPLHRDSVERQMVMLGTGIELLNRIIDITVTEE